MSSLERLSSLEQHKVHAPKVQQTSWITSPQKQILCCPVSFIPNSEYEQISGDNKFLKPHCLPLSSSEYTLYKVDGMPFSQIQVLNTANIHVLHIFCYICSLRTLRWVYFTLMDSFKEYLSSRKPASEATA